MSHDDFDFEPAPGLPAKLPQGEALLWQGSPEWKSLAVRAYHVRKVAWYFLLLIVWGVGFGIVKSHPARDILVSCALLIALGGIAIGVLSVLAYSSSRCTVYSVTSRRILIRHGIAVPMTMNIPFSMVDGAALKVFSNGTGDIAITVPKKHRIGYLITWPHLRPGHITRPQPSFRALSDAQRAAELLSAALTAEGNTVHMGAVHMGAVHTGAEHTGAEHAGADHAGAVPTAASWQRAAEPRNATPGPLEPRSPDAVPVGNRNMGPRPAAVA